MPFTLRTSLLVGAAVAALVGPSLASADFGMKAENLLKAKTGQYFGFVAPLDGPADTDTPRPFPFDGPVDGADLVDLAPGLQAHVLTRDLANDGDMMAFYPLENPTHLIVCIENGRATDGTGQPINPALQSVDLATGEVATIAYGLNRCDGIRTTPWGTILATEETSDGAGYELLNPLSGDVFRVMSRGGMGGAATILDQNGNDASDLMIKRTDLPTMAWEGLAVLPSGVVYGGDELRPGTGSDDKDGGALFKFVPSSALNQAGPIGALADSPLASGRTYAFRADCQSGSSSNFPQFGQGCEIGNGSWVEVVASDARDSANDADATGYYRPEDLHLDPVYDGEGVRFCWANTGNEGASNYGEVLCGVDYEPLTAESDQATIIVNRFVEGDPSFNSVDNLAFQPGSGNLYVIEDHRYGEVYACLPDGADRDIKSDGCVRMLSVKDRSAEPTGFMFDASGRTAYLVIQHSDPDTLGDTDDLVVVTGFKPVKK